MKRSQLLLRTRIRKSTHVSSDDADVDGPQSKRRRIIANISNYPFEARAQIEVLIGKTCITEDDATNATAFVERVQNVVHFLLCVQGLDSQRHTVAQVESMIREFPNVLLTTVSSQSSRKKYYPVALQLCNHDNDNDNGQYLYPYRAIFLPLLVRLTIEFFGSSFTITKGNVEIAEIERGGLLLNDSITRAKEPRAVLQTLIRQNSMTEYDAVDEKFRDAMVQLHKDGNLHKHDVDDYDLFYLLLRENNGIKKRLNFLAQLSPRSLAFPRDANRRFLPLHYAANKSKEPNGIMIFGHVFNLGMTYLPFDLGINLLFYQDHQNETPYQDACKAYSIKVTNNIIGEILGDQATTATTNPGDNCNSNNSRNNNNKTVVDALVLAASNNTYHLDGVYFLLRRTPSILWKAQSAAGNNTMVRENANTLMHLD